MRIVDLTQRADLNGRTGLVTGPEHEGRLPTFVVEPTKVEGVNVRAANVEDCPYDPASLADAWTCVATALADARRYTKALHALERAVCVAEDASSAGDSTCVTRGCDALCSLCFLCLTMVSRGVGELHMDDGRKTSDVYRWGMSALFAEVVAQDERASEVTFGAGRIRDGRVVLLARLVDRSNEERVSFFYYDEVEHVVREEVTRSEDA